MAKAIAFATSRHRQASPVGPQRPGQRPPRAWRALLARRVGRWPRESRAAPSPVDPPRAGGGEAVPRLFPPGHRRVRVHTHHPCIIGEGHCLSHFPTSASLTGRASKARPAPAPRMAGASRPPGRAPASGISCRAVSDGTRTSGRGEAVPRLSRPDEVRPSCKVGVHTHLPVPHGEGHRLRHSGTSASGTGRASKARPAPDRPSAGASRPPGRVLASRFSCRIDSG